MTTCTKKHRWPRACWQAALSNQTLQVGQVAVPLSRRNARSGRCWTSRSPWHVRGLGRLSASLGVVAKHAALSRCLWVLLTLGGLCLLEGLQTLPLTLNLAWRVAALHLPWLYLCAPDPFGPIHFRRARHGKNSHPGQEKLLPRPWCGPLLPQKNARMYRSRGDLDQRQKDGLGLGSMPVPAIAYKARVAQQPCAETKGWVRFRLHACACHCIQSKSCTATLCIDQFLFFPLALV